MSPDRCAALRSWVLLLTATVSAEGRRAALPFRRVRGGLQAQGLPCGLNETRQLRRLEARRTGAHVQFHPIGEHEAHPGAALWEGRYREARWHLVYVRAGSQRVRAHIWYAIELCRDLGQRHTDFLQLADVDEAFQVRRSVVRSASGPKWGG